MARERAEETVLLVGIELGHVEGHRGGFLGADHLGVGNDARITFFQIILVDTGAQAVGGDRLHVSFFADHQVVAHDVLRQVAGVGQFDGEFLAALVDGEFFSWYGSRLIDAPAYFEELLNQIEA